MHYLLEIGIVAVALVSTLVILFIQNKKDKKVATVKPDPVVKVEAKELDGYTIVWRDFPYGPPSSESKLIQGKTIGHTDGEYLFVPLRVVSFPEGEMRWGIPAITIGTLYKKEAQDG